MAKQTDYSWAAGFFDGEGCVSLYTSGKYTGLKIILVQKDIRPIQKFMSVFGCTETLGVTRRRDRKHSYYRLIISGKRAADILTRMLPYLALKKDVAEIGIDLQATIDSYTSQGQYTPLTNEEIGYRKSLVARAKWLNSGRWAAATTKSDGPERVCDSLDCTDDKGAEVAEMSTRLQ